MRIRAWRTVPIAPATSTSLVPAAIRLKSGEVRAGLRVRLKSDEGRAELPPMPVAPATSTPLVSAAIRLKSGKVRAELRVRLKSDEDQTELPLKFLLASAAGRELSIWQLLHYLPIRRIALLNSLQICLFGENSHYLPIWQLLHKKKQLDYNEIDDVHLKNIFSVTESIFFSKRLEQPKLVNVILLSMSKIKIVFVSLNNTGTMQDASVVCLRKIK